jgi:hypothetical protein
VTADQLTLDDAIRQKVALLWILSEDPKNSSHVRAIAAVIGERIPVGAIFSANTIRPYIPGWVKPCLIGPAFSVLARRGALQFRGFEASTEPRTHGKPVGRWQVVR